MAQDRLTVGRQYKTFKSSPQFEPFSKVVIQITDDISISAGNDDGRTLTVSNPWGTQAMAENMLASIQGFEYQPYEAEGAMLNPAAELGDGVSVSTVYGGLYSIDTAIDTLCVSTIKAPCDEEIDHEYPFPDAVSDRATTRRFVNAESQISDLEGDLEEFHSTYDSEMQLRVDEINARVTKTGQNSSETFAWSLQSDSFRIHNGVIHASTDTIFKVDASGLTVKGKIQATEGYIGGSSGFVIKSGMLYSNGKDSLSSTKQGVYIGTDGIALGSRFKVDSSGNVTATNVELSGRITATSGTIGGINITASSLGGSGWSMSSSGGSFGGSAFSFSGNYANLAESVNVGGTRIGTYIKDLIAETVTASYISSKIADISLLRINSMQLGGHTISRSTIDGNKVLGWV